jgi:tRNA G37 N-methylase Trm5|eukprot:scaffold3144_cov290-Chaetoceros_neogracile.AAC.4
MEFLAGRPDTTVQLNEEGGERKRLLEEFKQWEIVADIFCGSGAFVVQAAAKLGCTVYAKI